MNIIQKIYYFFSYYTDSNERKVGKFFSKLNENSIKNKIYDDLIKLMQKDLVVINLWNERSYKGYDYLTKTKRKQLYKNIELIKLDFENHSMKNSNINIDNIISGLSGPDINTDKLIENKKKLIHILSIMHYLSPKVGRYAYRESSTFGELLKDPAKDLLIGDCNQIVTLYIYLYSLKYNINDLKILSYPGHVALQFMGVDIEATNGRFDIVQKEDKKVLPIQEIVSINLLDVEDSYFKTHKVSPKSFLQSARLAYLVSSEKDIVNKNLEIAYNNLTNELVRKHDYNLALKYAKLSNNKNLLNLVGHNGASYFLNNNQFSLARKFAIFSTNHIDIVEKINYRQGIYQFDKGQYFDAIKSFNIVGDLNLVKKCYEGLFMNEQKKLGKKFTSADIKQNKSVIHNMQNYARKSENKELIDHVSDLVKYL